MDGAEFLFFCAPCIACMPELTERICLGRGLWVILAAAAGLREQLAGRERVLAHGKARAVSFCRAAPERKRPSGSGQRPSPQALSFLK